MSGSKAMKTSSSTNRTGIAAAAGAAILLAAFTAPFLAHAQSNSASDVIQLVTGDRSVKLYTSSDSFCTAGSTGHALAVAVGDRCSSFGTSADLPESLYVKITADAVNFRSGGNSYAIRDASVVSSARALFAPVRDIMERQVDLGRQMSDLGKSESNSAARYSPAKLTVPDLTADFEKVEADAKRLSVQGGTQSELSELQSEISELQSRISEAQSAVSEAESRLSEQTAQMDSQIKAMDEQMKAMSQQSAQLDSQMKAMDEQMKAMSEQMNVWSRQGHDAAVRAAQQLGTLLEQAIASGAAKKE